VGADPGGHVAEVGFDGAGVEEGAGGVAVVEGVVLHVRLALYCVVRNGQPALRRNRWGYGRTHANSVIQLSDHAKFLVTRCVAGSHEGAVVCSYFCDVTVLSGAELRVVVARLCI